MRGVFNSLLGSFFPRFFFGLICDDDMFHSLLHGPWTYHLDFFLEPCVPFKCEQSEESKSKRCAMLISETSSKQQESNATMKPRLEISKQIEIERGLEYEVWLWDEKLDVATQPRTSDARSAPFPKLGHASIG